MKGLGAIKAAVLNGRAINVLRELLSDSGRRVLRA
jgi:hypothetical protein